MNAASYALDAYKASKSLSILEKSEMGIYGLVAANGMTEVVTGKDMFGNKLTEEQRQNSLLTALGIGGVGRAGYTFDLLASRNAMYNANSRVNPVVDKNKVDIRLASKGYKPKFGEDQ